MWSSADFFEAKFFEAKFLQAMSGRNGRAAAGWEQTLEAVSDGRVELLLVQNGVDRPAYECPKCGRAQVADGGCPLDGTTMESRENGFDLAMHKTLVQGGTVQRRHRIAPGIGRARIG